MANTQLTGLSWVIGQYNRAGSQAAYCRADYDPTKALNRAASLGIIDEKIVTLPLSLVNYIYPYFENYGVVALLDDYAKPYAEKAATIKLTEADKHRLFYCYWLANSFGIPNLSDTNYSSSYSPQEKIVEVSDLVEHLIKVWPYYEDEPSLCPGNMVISHASERIVVNTIGGMKSINDFAEFVASVPEPILEVLPPHIQVFAGSYKPKRSVAIIPATEWCARAGLLARTSAPLKPVRVS